MSERVKISIPKISFTDDAKFYVNYGVDGFKEVKGSDLQIVAKHHLEIGSKDGKNVRFHVYVRHNNIDFEVEDICERCCQSVKAVGVEKVVDMSILFRNGKYGGYFTRYIDSGEEGNGWFSYSSDVWTNEKGELKQRSNFDILGEYVYNPSCQRFEKDVDDIFDNQCDAMFFTKCKSVGDRSLADAMMPTDDDVSAIAAKMAELKALLDERRLKMIYDYDSGYMNLVKDGSELPEGYKMTIEDFCNDHEWSMKLPNEAYKELKDFGCVSEVNCDWCIRLNYEEPKKSDSVESK